MAGAILLLISGVFVFAAVSKLRTRSDFEEVLKHFLPRRIVTAAAIVVPIWELAMAVSLLNTPTQRTAIIASIASFIVFTFVLFELQRRGVNGCACFGESEADIGSGVVRNVILSGLAAATLPQSAPISCFGPDISSFLGRLTILTGVFCLWPCLLALLSLRKVSST